MSAETSLILALLADSRRVSAEGIKPDVFGDPWLRQVYHTMAEMVAAGEPVDVFTVSEKMACGPKLIALTRQAVGIPANIPYYLKTAERDARKRALVQMAHDLVEQLNGADSPDEVAGQMAERLAEMTRQTESRAYDGKGMMTLVVDRMTAIEEARRSGKPLGVKTGLPGLDRLLGGLHSGDLIVLGARPKMGKTAWLCTVAYNAALAGHRVGIISSEMSATEIGMRILSLGSGVAATKFRAADMGDDEWAKTSSGVSRISDMPIYILDQPAAKVGDVIRQARAWNLSGGLDLLVVDYLQRLDVGSEENRTLAVGMAAQQLKTLARNLNIPVVLLSQLSRNLESRTDKRPLLSDLRDSGMIEQEADEIIFLYRPSVYGESQDESEAEMIVAGNRHGPVGVIRARFNQDLIKWGEDAREYSDRWTV